MIKRFFFNGIDIHAARIAERKAVQGTVHIDFGTADSAIARRQHTPVRTDTANHPIIVRLFIKKPLV